MQRPLLTRSVSEPSHVKNTSLLTACSISRDRSKESVLSFEQGKDCIAVWLNKWNRKEVDYACTCLLKWLHVCSRYVVFWRRLFADAL